jgi:hypothetical protein
MGDRPVSRLSISSGLQTGNESRLASPVSPTSIGSSPTSPSYRSRQLSGDLNSSEQYGHHPSNSFRGGRRLGSVVEDQAVPSSHRQQSSGSSRVATMREPNNGSTSIFNSSSKRCAQVVVIVITEPIEESLYEGIYQVHSSMCLCE